LNQDYKWGLRSVIFWSIHEQLDDKPGKAAALNNQGEIYRYLGQYEEALEQFQQALVLYQQLEDDLNIGNTLGNIGLAHYYLGRYSQALGFYQQALEIARNLRNYAGEGLILNSIGKLHQQLGQPEQALAYYKEALEVAIAIGDRVGREVALSNIGQVFSQNNKPDEALQFYQQALKLARATHNPSGEGIALSNLGLLWASQGKDQRALALYEEALAIHQEIGDRASEGVTLSNMASVYLQRERHTEALSLLQQALAIHLEVGDRTNERIALSKLGKLFERQGQPELAIVFYKQAVNVAETQRQGLAELTVEQQRSYTQTVADTYRHLADLLLQQDRILEAQQVLDLLKVQELEDYLGEGQRTPQNNPSIELLSQEREVAEKLKEIRGREIALGKELTALREQCRTECTPTQEQRIAELMELQQLLRREFNRFIESDTIKALVRKLNETAQEQNLRLSNLNDLRRELQPDDVLLYPLILEDRLELVLISPDTPPVRRTVSVNREELNRAIVAFRRALQHRGSDAKPPAQKLYQWLVQPLESDLVRAEAKTIIYAPDGQLRYIPLAALHDGNHWLVERFGVYNITAASIDDLDDPRQTELRLLAGAFGVENMSVRVGSREFDFAGLPFAVKEVANLAETIPNTTQLLDRDFSPEATIPKMALHNVVHLATHATFVVGEPEESFILFGNGDGVSLQAVKSWDLPDVEMVVLSACETAVGGEFGTGEEILGFGYLMQQAGAKSAVASLWTVSDGGTQALMNAFYIALQNENVTKAEALRRAQIALITEDYSVLGEERGIIEVRQRVLEGLEPVVRSRLEHPYYWAPFILIGNGL
jgi:CHAT domain-containing protein/Tfp pilus assembly protein PilF